MHHFRHSSNRSPVPLSYVNSLRFPTVREDIGDLL